MPIRGLQLENNAIRDFDASRDRHLLRSESSGSLLDEGNLQFVLEDGGEQSAGSYLGAFDDVQIEFQPLFRAQKVAERYSGFGIHVDAQTGIVSSIPVHARRMRRAIFCSGLGADELRRKAQS